MDPSILAVSTQRNYVRLYDVRTGSPHAVLQFGPPTSSSPNLPVALPAGANNGHASSALAVSGRFQASGLASDPFSSYRLAAWDEGPPMSTLTGTVQPSLRDGRAGVVVDSPSGGTVRIWDSRSPRTEVLRLDGPAPGGGKTGGGSKGGGELRTGAVGVKWDLEREGRLVVLERGGDLSVWDMVDPLRGGGKEGEREGVPLVIKGEPIRSECFPVALLFPLDLLTHSRLGFVLEVPPGPLPTQSSAFTFSYIRPKLLNATTEASSAAELQCRLAIFSRDQGGEIRWPDIIERSPVSLLRSFFQQTSKEAS